MYCFGFSERSCSVWAVTPHVRCAEIFAEKKMFYAFLRGKLSRGKNSFTITFKGMADSLNLSRVPEGTVQSIMDEIVLSVPGMAKTETGYTVSDLDLLNENFRAEVTRDRIISLLSSNLGKSYTYTYTYTYTEVAHELGISVTHCHKLVVKLIQENKIVVVKPWEHHGRQKTKTEFTIAT